MREEERNEPDPSGRPCVKEKHCVSYLTNECERGEYHASVYVYLLAMIFDRKVLCGGDHFRGKYFGLEIISALFFSRKVRRAYQSSWNHRCQILFCCVRNSNRKQRVSYVHSPSSCIYRVIILFTCMCCMPYCLFFPTSEFHSYPRVTFQTCNFTLK